VRKTEPPTVVGPSPASAGESPVSKTGQQIAVGPSPVRAGRPTANVGRDCPLKTGAR
jgi:hypothetical protein